MTAGAVSAIGDPSQRARQISFVLWAILGLNWFVALFKLLLGFWMGSTTVFADGLHSFSDGASNIIGLIGMSFASHPADYDHPYGHEKYETLAATVIALLLFGVSYRIAYEAAKGWFAHKTPEVTNLSFALMGATLLVNLFIVFYERKKARELQSDLLQTDSWHTMTDVFVTLSVIGALVGIRLGIPHVDSIFALGIAAIIIVIALRLLKSSSDVLVDKAPIESSRIEIIVRKVSGVRDCHEIRARGKPGNAFVDLHVLVDPNMTVEVSHRLANIIERDIRHSIPGVRDVVVHIEPVTHGHEELAS